MHVIEESRSRLDMASSAMTLVCWPDAFAAPLPQEVARAAASIDWQRSARDVNLF